MSTSFYPEVTFKVGDSSLSGKLYQPDGKGPFPVLLIYHGYRGRRQDYGLFAREILSLGIAVFAFNFRGCGKGTHRSDGDINQQTIADQMVDALAAYDYLARLPTIDPARIAGFGSSLGGYLAACVSGTRSFRSLILSAPALYRDDWRDRTVAEIPQEALHQYRRTVEPEETQALRAIAAFTGNLLVIRHANDEQVPERVPELYYQVTHQAQRRELKVLADTPHQITKSAQAERLEWVKAWLRETLTTS